MNFLTRYIVCTLLSNFFHLNACCLLLLSFVLHAYFWFSKGLLKKSFEIDEAGAVLNNSVNAMNTFAATNMMTMHRKITVLMR